MSLTRLRSGQHVDGDREGARRFLDAHGLVTDADHETSVHLLNAAGAPLSFGDYRTDLHIDPLDTAGPFSAGIWHATLSEQECDFIFDLCVAAGFLVCDHQGDPYFIVPAGIPLQWGGSLGGAGADPMGPGPAPAPIGVRREFRCTSGRGCPAVTGGRPCAGSPTALAPGDPWALGGGRRGRGP